MNAVLVERAGGRAAVRRSVFLVLTLFSEAALLVVAAQAGFLDGPRVLANMAVDSWVPHRFAALSERLTTQNGIVLMGGAALAALLYTRGDVGHLVVMYSINVFLTFSLSMAAHAALLGPAAPPAPAEWRAPAGALRRRRSALCVTILAITVFEKFAQGGWITVLVTSARHRAVLRGAARTTARPPPRPTQLYRELGDLAAGHRAARGAGAALDPDAADRRAAGRLLRRAGHSHPAQRLPGVSRPLPARSSSSRSAWSTRASSRARTPWRSCERRTEEMLAATSRLGAKLGVAATARMALGTDVVEPRRGCVCEVAREFPQATFFAAG